MRKLVLVSVVFVVLLFSSLARATLIDRGNGLIYDTVNDISWIKDADVSGSDTWDNQVSWAAGFSLAGFDDFRLASLAELESLYDQLPGAPGDNKTGDISPFLDIANGYWSGTEVDAANARGFDFDSGVADSDLKSDFDFGWAVRRGDSVAAVPEVGSGLLMGLGLLGMRLARWWHT